MFHIPPLCLLKLSFHVLTTIDNLPHYHGLHISALFRYLIRPYIPKDKTLSSIPITIVPVDTGVNSFSEGESFHVYLSYPYAYHETIKTLIDELSGRTTIKIHLPEGHFIPGKTIVLKDARCRITDESVFERLPLTLNHGLIKDEVELLGTLDEFSLLLYTPLRLTRPKGSKTEGHRYYDEDFFHKEECSINPVEHILNAINKRLAKYNPPSQEKESLSLKIKDSSLLWVDCPYGHEPVKTIGGVVGKIKLYGTCSEVASRALVLGQYTNFGKNTVFGFGAYIIPELNGVRKIKPPIRGKTLLERAFDMDFLKNALYRLPNSSPGTDGITVSDAKKAGTSFLEKINQNILSGTYTQGELKRYRLPKEDGKFRDIYVQCVSDRLIHKAIADCLAPAVDRLLMSSAWAYRKGLNRMGAVESLNRAISEGFTEGIKADIATFFDSVNTEKLISILEGLFPFDPVVDTIDRLIAHFTEKGIKGLPQGSPLSPVLSNLYLTKFAYV